MQFSNILSTAAAALALGANAGVLPPRQNGEIAQFRVYGAEGCSDLNLGFYPVYAEDKGVCKSLTDADDVVLSVALELNTENACALYIYTDGACSAGRRAVGTVGDCNNPLNAGETWGSWEYICQ